MQTIQFSGRTPIPQSLTLGVETDANVETLHFDLPQISDPQIATLQLVLPDGVADLLLIGSDGNVLIPGRIMEIEGTARALVEVLGTDGRAWHSEVMRLGIGETPDLSARTEQQYPTALQEAVSRSETAQAAAEAAQDIAENAAAVAAQTQGITNFELDEDGHMIMVWSDPEGTEHEVDLGPVSAYAIAVAAGYTGTEEEFAEDMGNSADNATSAAADAERAETAADSVSVATEAEVKTYLGIA